ncbi:MAG: Tat pathway signal protein [Spirochaetaceae bacterium]|nr:MAG: Tat pathway signal protein [Spirochaetaceae bacterium]
MRDPWYRTARRWGQTNLTEIDPEHYDRSFWIEHWRRTAIDGVIVNAGGIVAYYPSDVPLHYRAERLGSRDLFGEIVADARDAGLSVLARMDCNRALPEFYDAQPDWFVTNADGRPVVTQGRYVACVNSPYYHEHIPLILSEIISRYRPDGFTDNSWTGAGAKTVCHCPHCRDRFREATGLDLPLRVDWDARDYRAWVTWSYSCRMDNWRRFNDACRNAGGDDCLWLGMVNANPFGSHVNFADLREIGRVSQIMMCDHQSRDALNGFEQNAVNGLLLHGVSGDETTIPESMAHYVRGVQAFRRASMPPEEVRTWMRCAVAGGISPWWHHVGASQEDQRQFETSVDLFGWHAQHERWLYGRRSLAEIGVAWSHQNVDFYGRDDRETRCALPWRGITAAMTRARIPFTPVHASDIPTAPEQLRAIVLPDVAVLSDEQCDRVTAFVNAGGSIVLTGRTGTLDIDGMPRREWPFAQLTGARPTGNAFDIDEPPTSSWEVQTGHTYLRIDRTAADASHAGSFAGALADRFAGTALLPFGGSVFGYSIAPEAEVAATLVPPSPIYPPEFSWMRTPRSSIPAIVTRTLPGGGRVVLLAADIDRQYGRLRLPDHGDLLASAIEWAGGPPPVTITGPGYLSCHAYWIDNAIVVHIVNLTGANEWPGYLEQLPPVGPVTLSLRPDIAGRLGGGQGAELSARSLVTGRSLVTESTPDGSNFGIDRLVEHDVVLITELDTTISHGIIAATSHRS